MQQFAGTSTTITRVGGFHFYFYYEQFAVPEF